ncbi:hypothetical protein GLOIN_2v1775842 [Rhizophagus irregularis DAOM 181602=DAOM 197198]|uniref:Uncharacterized protein n=1 Tax=Rhizophagus irregularis (strain DAOM 181602 / DAOM 197198 / MUCL 43194) TaxID=747089 RepID=U9UNK4_RHIID|nr:hypothetical protein GLOIN_2v1775842 [Rhizophagus irregularis DAOM 181602=DAOM 197198]PKY17770.1 hypothetical protein RhiirB3_430459 [Rhizophagus irregularis]POG70378.1 hypothetical protein GLOIN_2v1775842 [Rhizophagus irregularis DAOM 181602=DAOM 197198]GBC15715.1 hypothetical protein GLOIN_2v1775842 [Rhizophagus irregularis DAOM 181602=DAOM 197198]GBC29596.1 hypothetical protein GLOIN_2v1775842 [Rhizophagus irregularis DAOM 181602=DAOM 197198]|eukprot:XP_025177244.1 hypothetical protein GLOIN_2v1775842 [Rhizophagus irregularis DAOM 181602=DAOM 197198]
MKDRDLVLQVLGPTGSGPSRTSRTDDHLYPKILNEWIIKGDPVPNSKGYYSATCSFCEFYWITAKVAKLKRHLAYDCNKIDSETKINVLMMLTSNENSENGSTITSTTKSSKKQKSSDTRSQT